MFKELDKLVSFLKSRDEILFAYMFGSQSRGNTHSLSDLDIAIYVKKEILNSQEYLYGYIPSLLSDLPNQFQKKQIDIVILNEAPVLLRHRAIHEGKLLF